MTTIIMLFLFPIGLYVYFVVEKKQNKVYQAVFDDFQTKISTKEELTTAEKKEQFEAMLLQNGYELVEVSEEKVVGEKKVLSMGLILIGTGVYIIGLFVYLAYFYGLQKPHVVEFKI